MAVQEVTADPFSFLHCTINVLVVEDDLYVLAVVREHIEQVPVYKVFAATTAKEADALLRSKTRIHLAILGLNITDMEADEFYLLRHHSRNSVFVVYTGCASPARGAQCAQLGALAVIEKGTVSPGKCLPVVNRYALLSLVAPADQYDPAATVWQTIDRLFGDTVPRYVDDWAGDTGISTVYMRKIWARKKGIPASDLLCIFSLYRMAFEYYEKCLADTEAGEEPGSAPSDKSEFERYKNRFLMNEARFRAFLK